MVDSGVVNARHQERARRSEMLEKDSLSGYRILILEDEPGVAEMERREVEALGPAATVVHTVADALLALRDADFDLAVVDYVLPDGTADEFLDRMERLFPRTLPFLVTTGMGDEKVAVRMMKRGAIDYLLKDHAFVDIFSTTIERALEGIDREARLAAARGKLAEIERKFLVVSEYASDVIFLLNPWTRKLTYASSSIARMLGLSCFDPETFRIRDHVRKKDFLTLFRAIDMKVREARMCASPEKPELRRVDIKTADGSTIKAEVSLSAVEDKDGSIEILGIVRDIGKRLEVEEALRHSLEEKEVLLREVHHRVKNNLQMVSSLLSLQMKGSSDRTVIEALEKSQGRIRTMAIIHEQLCESDDVTGIPIGPYLKRIAKSVLELADRDATPRFEIDDAAIDLSEAVPCGLILNELLVNALRYGCPTDDAEITVHFAIDGSTRLLKVCDEGPGFPRGFDPSTIESLGLTLVTSLANQLGGAISWGPGEGGLGSAISVAWQDSR